MKKTISGMSLALGLLGGCAADGSSPKGPVSIVPLAESRADLDRLRALQIFDVNGLVLELPAEATACYNAPCGGWEDQVAAELARQMPRLDRLTNMAEYIRPEYEGAEGPGPEQLAADLQTLRDLQIVGIGELMVTVPASDPNCYNLPCPGAKEAAERENNTRAAFVHALAGLAESTGL